MRCLECAHYVWWDGDPCCTDAFNIILPDLDRTCEDFRKTIRKKTEYNILMWNANKHEWFANLKFIDCPEYFKQHPEYEKLVAHS